MTASDLLKYRLEIWRSVGALPDRETVRHRIENVLAESVSADRVVLGSRGHVRSAVRHHRVRMDSYGSAREDLWVKRQQPLSGEDRKILRALWREAREVLAAITRVEEVVEAERHRQALRLHQGPAQALVRALLALHLCRQEAARDPVVAQKLQNQAVDFVRQALCAVRDAIRLLKSQKPAFPGMERAIRDVWDQLQVFTEARLLLDLECPEALPEHVEEGLAAVACEAVTNAARHAGASRIEVRLRRGRGAVTLEVFDDGKGMGAGFRPGRGRRSLGLALMQEQVKRLKGQLRIHSGVEGTRIRVVVPLGAGGCGGCADRGTLKALA